MRRLAIVLAAVLVSLPSFALDLGQAEGSLAIDQSSIPLAYAYAVGKQRNEITNKNDTRVILTDKALAPDVNFNEIDATFPADMYGLLLNISSAGKVTRVVLLHPKGTYDGGFLEDVADFHFKSSNAGRGMISGHVTSSKVKTSTVTFGVDADFIAQVK